MSQISWRQLWNGLINFVYENIKIDYVVDNVSKDEYEIYYNRTSSWYDCPIKGEKVCKGYRECTLRDQREARGSVEYVFQKLNPNNIEFALNFQPRSEEKEKMEEKQEKEEKQGKEGSWQENLPLIDILQQVKEQIENCTKIECIIFDFGQELELQNVGGENTDHRGSNHTQIFLPFYSRIFLPQKFSLYTLATALYDLKSHKFDLEYEVFREVHVKNNLVQLFFDHPV